MLQMGRVSDQSKRPSSTHNSPAKKVLKQDGCTPRNDVNLSYSKSSVIPLENAPDGVPTKTKESEQNGHIKDHMLIDEAMDHSVGDGGSNKTNRTLRRRSSFARGRRSVIMCNPNSPGPSAAPTFAPAQSQQLENETTMSHEERLQKALKHSVEATMQDIQDTLPEMDGMQQYGVQLRERCCSEIAEMRVGGQLKEATATQHNATHQHSGSENDKETQDSKTTEEYKQYQQYKLRLDKESQRWDELLADIEQQQKLAKSACENVEPLPVTGPPPTLTKHERDVWTGHLNLQEILQVMKASREVGQMLAHIRSESLKHANRFATLCKNENQQILDHIGAEFSVEDAQCLIKDILHTATEVDEV